MRWIARDGLKSYTYNLSDPRAPAIQGHISEDLIYSLVCANTTRQLQQQPFPEWCGNTGTGRLAERKNIMRFSQLFLRIGYSTVIKVYKCEEFDESQMRGELVDEFKRCDRVPRDIWSAHVYRVWPVDQDSIAVMI